MFARYEISFTTVIKAGCDWANIVFGQQWTVDPEFDDQIADEEDDSDTQTESNNNEKRKE